MTLGAEQALRGRVQAKARPLTPGEWGGISPGLAEALRRSGARPRLSPRAHPAARVASLWRGGVPILARGDDIWWPGVPEDLSVCGHGPMAGLQHELQHVLDYRLGLLSGWIYLTQPRHWIYSWTLSPDTEWRRLGAEQRASMVERFYWAERLAGLEAELDRLGRLIPWAGGALAADGGRRLPQAALGGVNENPASSV